MAATGSAFRIIGSRWRDSLLRHLATTPGAMRCRLDRPGHATTTWSAPVRPTTLCACHSELMMASSLIHSSNAPIDVGMQPSKKLDNRNEPVTWLHLCYRLAMIRMPVSMSAASGRTKLRRMWESSISSTSNTLPGMNVTPWERQDSNTSRERTPSGKETQI